MHKIQEHASLTSTLKFLLSESDCSLSAKEACAEDDLQEEACEPDNEDINLEEYSGPKKYSKKTSDGKTVRYGAKGYRIAPGTSKGDSYCARSNGQMKKHTAAAKDPNSPLRLSRKKWKCSGDKSRKD